MTKKKKILSPYDNLIFCKNCALSSKKYKSYVFCAIDKVYRATNYSCKHFKLKERLQYKLKEALGEVDKLSPAQKGGESNLIKKDAQKAKKKKKLLCYSCRKDGYQDAKKNKSNDKIEYPRHAPSTNDGLILFERRERGLRMRGHYYCSECKRLKLNTWSYEHTTCGFVYLCDKCKTKVFDRSFGKIDALDRPHIGNFEGNRNRH